jgi:hypothetical protein
MVGRTQYSGTQSTKWDDHAMVYDHHSMRYFGFSHPYGPEQKSSGQTAPYHAGSNNSMGATTVLYRNNGTHVPGTVPMVLVESLLARYTRTTHVVLSAHVCPFPIRKL